MVAINERARFLACYFLLHAVLRRRRGRLERRKHWRPRGSLQRLIRRRLPSLCRQFLETEFHSNRQIGTVGTEEQWIQRCRGSVGTDGQIALSITAVICSFAPVNNRKKSGNINVEQYN